MATSGSAAPPGEGCSVLSLLVRGPNIRDIRQDILSRYLTTKGTVLSTELHGQTILVKMATSSEGAAKFPLKEVDIAGKKIEILLLSEESATFTLSGPVLAYKKELESVVLKLCKEYNLQYSSQEARLAVSGPIEALYFFRQDLAAHVQKGVDNGIYDVETILASYGGPQSPTMTDPDPSSTGATGATFPPHTESSFTSSTGASGEEFPPYNGSSSFGEHDSGCGQRFDKMSPDVLALLQKIPDGEIPGVTYDLSSCSVFIQGQSRNEQEDRITKFQSAYQNAVTSGRLKVEAVQVPARYTSAQATDLAARFNEKYNQCVFTYFEDANVIKVVSTSSRQFEQAKKLLLEETVFPVATGTNPTGASVVTVPASGFSKCEVLQLPSGRALTLKKGNIVEESADVLVNAANRMLSHAGGVAGALDQASGGVLQRYSDAYLRQKGEVRVGDVAVTHAGEWLNCQRVFHAVGPDSQYPPNECRRLISRAISRCLELAEKYNYTSIAFPALSSGIFGVDKELVASTIMGTIVAHRFTKPVPVMSDIRIVIIDRSTYTCFARRLVQSRAERTASKPAAKKEKNKTASDLHDASHSHSTTEVPEPHIAGLGELSNPGNTSFPIAHPHDPGIVPSKPSGVSRQNSSPARITSSPLPPDIPLSHSDLPVLHGLLRDLAPRWRHVGSVLGIGQDILNSIAKEEGNNVARLQKVILMWVTQTDNPTTLCNLIAALTELQAHDIAQRVTSHFGKNSSAPPVPAASPDITTTHPPNPNITYPGVNEGGDPGFIDSSVDKPPVATPSPIPTPGVTNTAGTMVAGGGGHGSITVTAGGGTGHPVLAGDVSGGGVRPPGVGGPGNWSDGNASGSGPGVGPPGNWGAVHSSTSASEDKRPITTQPVASTTKGNLGRGASETRRGIPGGVYGGGLGGEPGGIQDGGHDSSHYITVGNSRGGGQGGGRGISHYSGDGVSPVGSQGGDHGDSHYNRGGNYGGGHGGTSRGGGQGSSHGGGCGGGRGGGRGGDQGTSRGGGQGSGHGGGRGGSHGGGQDSSRGGGQSGNRGGSQGGGHGDSRNKRGPPGFKAKGEATDSGPTGGATAEGDECPICLDRMTPDKIPVQTGCGHMFCRGCIDKALWHNPYCPVCKMALRAIVGNQPQGGRMACQISNWSLPGYERCRTIQITYDIPGGIQGPEHPNPGRPFTGTYRVAYLPDTYEGREVLQLLQRAFDARLIFTVDTSITTGAKNAVVWNDIHHKTSRSGGAYGYPDPTYLQRVKQDLAAKGIITEHSTV